MPVPQLTLRDALGMIARLGKATLEVSTAAARASLQGELSFEEQGSELVLRVGCACEARVQRDRLRHAVFGPRAGGHGYVQLFDGNYDKVVAFVFPGGGPALAELATRMDGNDFEIQG